MDYANVALKKNYNGKSNEQKTKEKGKKWGRDSKYYHRALKRTKHYPSSDRTVDKKEGRKLEDQVIPFLCQINQATVKVTSNFHCY